MHFLNGWFKFPAGKGREFLEIMRPMLPRINRMPGVLYLEMAPRDGDPDVIVVVEAFDTIEAHDAMWRTDEFKVVKATLDRLNPTSRFDSHDAAFAKTAFWGTDTPPVGSNRLPVQPPDAGANAVAAQPGMKFVVGWLHFKPGTRDGFIERAQPLIEKIRAEDGNVFFELNPRVGQPDTAVLNECFAGDAAHRAHKQLPHMTEMFAALGEVIASGDVKVHFAEELFEDV